MYKSGEDFLNKLYKDAAGGKGREIAKMENYPGFKEISGSELIDKMNDQMQNTVLEEFNHVEAIAKINALVPCLPA